MKITIIGATGMAGSALVAEALRRGHAVTALARSAEKLAQLPANPQLTTKVQDAFELTTNELSQADVVIDAFATAPNLAFQHVDLAARLVAKLRATTTPRLVFILGAGSLQTGDDHHLFVDDIAKDPQAASFLSIPQNQLKELNFLRDVDNVNWVGVSPAADFHPGAAQPYLLGADELLVNADQQSATSAGTMAVAILDEIEHPQHQQTRFTVADK
ncbi:NAD(P)-dependent oxidoreductase [Levilactobacillus tujiorum]|uniref:NAD(P)H-binding protein n=1 Tax=Levilactobacillus tujiorum TaxID=2912243 RepID=A0ABX1L417_9LACO|nr:NAD(P)H-binding protein [Levilactobacillus tujiorum]MCH5464187.1 NAD(P)H-binding protein [Levilactobacillus tujiorum]NLR11627.1 NAD(P)H-binding protein [Lactobacillus sp. HBUAS51387]NLR29091.1 NAD(P)H-binding protein [Levilactobacillus tujiorum]